MPTSGVPRSGSPPLPPSPPAVKLYPKYPHDLLLQVPSPPPSPITLFCTPASPPLPHPLLTSCRQLQQLEEQKKQLEHYNATIQEEKDTLVLQNNSLTERLEAVTNEKLPSHQFDGQTPIDKTLDLLQCLIMVGHLLSTSCLRMKSVCLLRYLRKGGERGGERRQKDGGGEGLSCASTAQLQDRTVIPRNIQSVKDPIIFGCGMLRSPLSISLMHLTMRELPDLIRTATTTTTSSLTCSKCPAYSQPGMCMGSCPCPEQSVLRSNACSNLCRAFPACKCVSPACNCVSLCWQTVQAHACSCTFPAIALVRAVPCMCFKHSRLCSDTHTIVPCTCPGQSVFEKGCRGGIITASRAGLEDDKLCQHCLQ